MTIKQKIKYNNFPFGIYGLLLVTIIVFLIATQGTVSPSHLLNIIRSASPLGLAAIGQTIVLLIGGLDLSIGATMSMVNVVLAAVMNGENRNVLPAIALSLLFCALIGFVNGLVITKFQMQPFLVTMAMGIIVQGCYYLYTQGIARGSIAESVRFLSEGWIGVIPIALIIWAIIWGILSFVLYKTVFGRKIYLVGASSQAAKLSGFHVDAIKISAYILSSLLAGAGGILLSTYVGVSSIDIGNDYTLNTIASAVIGGAAFTGGIGNLEGTFPGVLIITILGSLMTILGISSAGKFICQGVVIAVMVAINQMKLRK